MLDLLRRSLAVSLAAAALAGCAALPASNPNALWEIVDGQCVPSQKANGTPGNCTLVNLAKHYAILKDIFGHTQYLLIPTDRITGIESPLILAPDAQDYWVDAWEARRFTEQRAKKTMPDNQLGLEINAKARRSQSQLHIHIDCMRPDVIGILAPHRGDVLGQWQWLTLDGERYRVMRVANLEGENNPFRVVARDQQGSAAMAQQTILVTGTGETNKDGWLIVNSGLNIENGSGNAERLLDHECRIAQHN
jgi:CDP-diacylglycerol pyrophosphatase